MRLTGFGTQARFHSGTTPHEIAKRLAVAIPFMINDPKDIAAGASRPQPEQPDHNPTPSLRPSLLPPSASASLAVPCSSVSRCLLSPFLARPQSLPLAPSLSAPPYPGLSAGPPRSRSCSRAEAAGPMRPALPVANQQVGSPHSPRAHRLPRCNPLRSGPNKLAPQYQNSPRAKGRLVLPYTPPRWPSRPTPPSWSHIRSALSLSRPHPLAQACPAPPATTSESQVGSSHSPSAPAGGPSTDPRCDSDNPRCPRCDSDKP
jgi:hypothetical protein